MPRPRTQIDMERVLEMSREGHSLAQIAKTIGVAEKTLADRCSESADYARARDIGIEREFDEILAIADEECADAVAVQRNRNRIDVRKWRLAKRFPKKYGDRTEIEHNGSMTVNVVTGVPEPKPKE